MKLIQSAPWLVSTGLLFLGSLTLAEPASPAKDEVVFRSVEGRKLEKTFVQHSELDLEDVSVTVHTPDGPQEQELEDAPGLTIVDDETIVFLDETLSAGEGKPKKLKRGFGEIENTQTFESEAEGAEDTTVKNLSGFAGKTVVFTWDDEEDAYEAAWHESEGDDALLAILVEDADFRGWLPGKEVAEGDTWEIPASEFNNLQEPSGPMAYVAENSEEKYEDSAISKGLRDDVDGDFKATYKGTREEDGVKVGVIEFEADLASEASEETEAEGEGPKLNSKTALSMTLKGELLWDLEGGHFTALNCDSEMKMKVTNEQTVEFGGNEFRVEQVQEFAGKKTYRFACAVKKD